MGEPTITCDGPQHVTVKYDGSGTTGSMAIDYTGCHYVVLNFEVKCKTAGAPEANTVLIGGTFHNVTVGTAGTRGVFVTTNKAVLECENTKKISLEGTLVGTVTKPNGACGSLKTKVLQWSIGVVGESQEHNNIIGSETTFGLTAATEGRSAVPFAEEASGTFEALEGVTITCNNP